MPEEELLLFAPLLRELKAERQLVAERERRSTFSGRSPGAQGTDAVHDD